MNHKIFTSLFFLFLSAQVFAQISYQAVVRDENGTILSNEVVSIGVNILQNGDIVYSEDHPNLNSGILGIINLSIGNGENASGIFGDIDWSLTNYEINIEINGTPLPSSPINSVPIAEYAKHTGDWVAVGDSILYNNDAYVGIGTDDPVAALNITGEQDATLNDGGGIVIGDLNIDNLVLDRNEIMARDGGAISDLNIQSEGGEIRFHANLTQPEKVIIKEDGKVGIGVSNPVTRLHLQQGSAYAQLMLERTGSNAGHSTLGGSSNGLYIGHFDEGGTYHVDAKIDHAGKAEVKCLQINGGCDITEPFSTSIDKQIDPGMVVVMTENGIELSEKSHDPRVVGVISGANGVNTGMQLSQNELFDEGLPVAIAGRVYVKTAGTVEIGDLLVSSDRPGLAMAEHRMELAFNRTIGKALTKPDENGFVLMLVNIQ